MKRILLFVLLGAFISCTVDRDFPEIENPINENFEIIHYWDFNDVSSLNTLVTPTFSSGGIASLHYDGNFDPVNPGSEINVRLSSEIGSALRLRNPSSSFVIQAPTVGYKDVIMSYAVTRTGSGSQTQKISYALDGLNYTSTGLTQSEFSIFEDVYVMIQIDFRAISGVNNNPNFKIKIEFDSPSATINNGNNRIDNLTFDGIPMEDYIPVDPIGDLALIHYWHFNDNTSNETLIAPNVGAGQLSYFGSYFDSVTPGSSVNVRNDSAAGTALRLRNPSGDFIMSVPTLGHQNIQLKYAATRTGSGSQTQTIFYSVDGVNFTQSGLDTNQFTLTEDVYGLIDVDFSNIISVNNNPNFKIKIVFDQVSSTISNGNNRIDNITIEGNAL